MSHTDLQDEIIRKRTFINYFIDVKHITILEATELYKRKWFCLNITYCFMSIVHHYMKLERSIYESYKSHTYTFTNITHLTDLFNKNKFNNIIELDCQFIPWYLINN